MAGIQRPFWGLVLTGVKAPRHSACPFQQKPCAPLSGSENLTGFGLRAKPDLLLVPKACGSKECVWQKNPVFKRPKSAGRGSVFSVLLGLAGPWED